MNNTILMIVHQKSSITGRIGSRLEQRGYTLDVRCPMAGHRLPEQLDAYYGAMSFGGPMSANDEHEPGVRAELDWLPRLLAAEKPFLGVCLGAQILARCLAAKVDFHTEGFVEIGYYPIVPTATANPVFSKPMHVYQWHRQGFDLPREAVLLAQGEYFENQAFRYGKNAYGLQFHPEVTSEMMARWMNRGAHRMSLPGAQQASEHIAGRARYDPALSAWLDTFLDRWLNKCSAIPAQSMAAG